MYIWSFLIICINIYTCSWKIQSSGTHTVPGVLLLRSLHMLNALQHRGARNSLRAIICGGRAFVLGRWHHDYLCGFGPDLCWSRFEGCLHHMWAYITSGWNHCSLKWNMARIGATSDTAGSSFFLSLNLYKLIHISPCCLQYVAPDQIQNGSQNVNVNLE